MNSIMIGMFIKLVSNHHTRPLFAYTSFIVYPYTLDDFMYTGAAGLYGRCSQSYQFAIALAKQC